MDFEKTVLGIEFGSTRIKAVMVDEHYMPIASGSYEWENQLIDGIWTYSMEKIHHGLEACYADLKRDVRSKFGVVPERFAAIGISGMMHGYLPFDKEDRQLAEFRTWRNTMTGQAADELTDLLGFNIPQRWSIAHLWQAILNGEAHTKDIAHLTTLAGYIHFILTGEYKMGIGEASGVFPIDSQKLDYNEEMISLFDAEALKKGMPWKLRDILPQIVIAGNHAGTLTESGALILDPEGDLRPGIPFAPCEGDAGTGMTATNSVRARTGNVSAGTSAFAMLVADHELGVHKEICMVTTPAGLPVAMVHCANCTSDINAWVSLLAEFAEMTGTKISKNQLYTMLFNKALEGDPDCSGLLSFNLYSGEGVTGVNEGRLLFARMPDSSFTLANFMRTHLLSALATLKIGMDILTAEENIPVDKLYGHGGFFKTPGVGQRILSAAVNAPVSVMQTAGEGGPYGMALLAAYTVWKEDDETLEDFLDRRVFANAASTTIMADQIEVAGFDSFLARYKAAYSVEKAAIKTMR